MKPPASISLDLDNQWSYMKIHGDRGWERHPSYFDIFIPHVLGLLDELVLKITFFIVGQDAAIDTNGEHLRKLTEQGHHVGNHSFSHESWLHLLPKDKITEEIVRADTVINSITGRKPIGFRGPGFCWSVDILETLAEQGYLFDASILPTWLGPIGRMYYFWKSNLTNEEKSQRKELFGKYRDGLKPVKSFRCILPSGREIAEIPVSTIPVLKVPFHLSYLLYLSRISTALMNAYLTVAILFCKATRTSPSFLLHPLDLVGGDQLQSLKFFPGMDLTSAHKTEIFKTVITRLRHHFNLVSLNTYATELKNTPTIRTRYFNEAKK